MKRENNWTSWLPVLCMSFRIDDSLSCRSASLRGVQPDIFGHLLHFSTSFVTCSVVSVNRIMTNCVGDCPLCGTSERILQINGIPHTAPQFRNLGCLQQMPRHNGNQIAHKFVRSSTGHTSTSVVCSLCTSIIFDNC